MAYVTEKLAALADPTRLAVFERLAKSPAAVHEIAHEFPVSRPAISQHLRVLKDACLVLARRWCGDDSGSKHELSIAQAHR